MKKMVILTEGQTEQIFISELIQNIASTSPYKLQAKKLLGGKRFATIEMEVSLVTNSAADPEFYILILDCASDGRVVSALRDRYDGFIAQDFSQMIVVRDLRPDFEFDERTKAEDGFAKQLPIAPVCPVVVLATMEVEAWFISELTHFAKIDNSLDESSLRAFGITSGMDFERILEPAEKLTEVYGSVGVSYGKSKMDIQRTVDAINKDLYITDFTNQIPSIQPLMKSMIEFFAA